MKNTLRKYHDYHQVVHEIDHMSYLHVNSSFYKQSMKIDNNYKIKEWINNSIGQPTVIQELDKKCLHYPIQTKLKTEEGTSISKLAHISFVV